jgi:hypothetical protein
MFGGLGHSNRVGKTEAEAFDVFEGLSATVRPIHETQIVEMDISTHMGIGDLLRKDREQGKFLLNPFGKGEIRGLRPVRNVGILLIRMEDELVYIEERHS